MYQRESAWSKRLVDYLGNIVTTESVARKQALHSDIHLTIFYFIKYTFVLDF